MALAYEAGTDLAFDTDVLRTKGGEYANIAAQLRSLASELDTTLENLSAGGWSTPAGTAFHEMAENGWKENIGKYADLLDTLNEILSEAADEYDALMEDYIRVTKVKA